MKINYSQFRKNLVVIRVINRMTAKELSEKCNLRQKKRIADIENGRGVPSLEEVVTICKILKVDIDSMLYKTIQIHYEFKNK